MAQEKSVFEAPLDGVTIARGVAEQLRDQLGDRLRRVVLYGSWARREGRIDSDVDILAVLSQLLPVDERFGGPLTEIAGDWFERGGRVVTIHPVSEGEIVQAQATRYPTARQMFLRVAASEGSTILDAA